MSYDKQLIYIEQLVLLQNRRLIIEDVALLESQQNLLLIEYQRVKCFKSVTANDLETSYILFLSQHCNIQRTPKFATKIRYFS